MYKTIIIFFYAAAAALTGEAQDTATLIKEFNRILSFSVQPYVYFTSTTQMEADPVVQKEDTMTLAGIFYKNETEIYTKNGDDEVFLEDSLLIQIDKANKKIMVSLVNIDTKANVNLLPLDKKKMQDMLKSGFVISGSDAGKNMRRLRFENKQSRDSTIEWKTGIDIEYSAQDHIPVLLSMDVKMKQLTDTETIAQLKNESVNIEGIAVKENGSDYLIRHQKFTIRFGKPDFSKEKASQIPLWQERLSYDPATREFSGKGELNDFEITKTF